MDKKNIKHLSIIVSFILVFGSLAPALVPAAQAQKVYIPSWIKQNAGWWSEGQIGDESFVQGLQYLIKEDILQIPETRTETKTSQVIPSWIKQNAGWWSDGQITDESFVNGIQWLVKNGIIVVETTPQEDDSNQPTTQPTVEINPVPWTRVNLVVDFNQNTAEYRAYQVSGDPFRIVCMEPCTIDEQLIFAKYQGFKKAHKLTVDFMGVDVLPELLPVDIHLNDDHFCNYVPGVSTGASASREGGSRVCVWDIEKENRFPEFTPENAIKVKDQGLVVHEYVHVILFKRSPMSSEDIAKAASFYISGFGDELIRDPCHEVLKVHSKLIYELCQQYGLTFDDFTQSIIEMDKLYHQQNYQTSLDQYRKILDDILNADTTQAFLDSGYTFN